MKKIKISKKHYNILKELADHNEITVDDVLYYTCDFINDNNIYKTWSEPFSNTEEEIEIETYNTFIDKWCIEFDAKPSTIVEYILEEVDSMLKYYEMN